MQEPRPILLHFDTHDDLVVAYSTTLGHLRVRIKTATPLEVGDAVDIRIRVAEEDDILHLPARVVEAAAQRTASGRYVAWVHYEPGACETLEDYIVARDPSSTRNVPAVQLRVVIVDDSDMDRERSAAAFRERGDEALLATDGLEGLALCLRSRPDLIISDVQMPKVDGFQLLRMLKSRTALKDTPVILVTTLASVEDRRLGYRLGVADYVTKPFAPEALRERANRVLHRSNQALGSWRPSSTETLQGRLAELNLPSLLSFLEQERKTGTIYLEHTRATITLLAGAPIRATQPGRASDDSHAALIYDLLSSEEGRFEFVAGSVETTDMVQATTTALLMEYARRQDEAARAARGTAS